MLTIFQQRKVACLIGPQPLNILNYHQFSLLTNIALLTEAYLWETSGISAAAKRLIRVFTSKRTTVYLLVFPSLMSDIPLHR
jgi:hypothetical protein